MQQLAPTLQTASVTTAPAQPVGLPPYARPTSGMNPMHSKTESTLAPTSEFTRLLLLALVSRYVLRGVVGEIFDPRTFTFLKNPVNKMLDGNSLLVKGAATKLNTVIAKHADVLESISADTKVKDFLKTREGKAFYQDARPVLRQWRIDASDEIANLVKDARRAIKDGHKTLDIRDGEATTAWKRMRENIRKRMDDIGYALSLGVGGAWLSITYSNLVRTDIKNIFSEVVAYEKGTSPDQVNFEDISKSQNRIIQKTVHNYWSKLGERLAVDALFVPAALSKSMPITDLVLGLKGVQALGETWKRKPTLFEDLVTFVNNKINPRNGLGQPVTVGEIFDIYQHYSEQFGSDKMFTNVVERGTGEGAIWANNQPIFQRIAELMNLTYAYKHASLLDTEGKAIHQANFPLPKLIYLLGHDLIDTRNPETTLAYIEVANRYGMEAVKDLRAQLSQGIPLEKMLAKYHVPELVKEKVAEQPVIEATNSITKPNHAEEALDSPATTISSERTLAEGAIVPSHAAVHTTV